MKKIVEGGRRSGKQAAMLRKAIELAGQGKTTAIITPADVVVVAPNATGIAETKKIGQTKKLPKPR